METLTEQKLPAITETAQPQADGRIWYFDRLRVASALCVVLLHSAAAALRTSQPRLGWHVLNLATSLATAAVPLFFMLSGALLLSDGRTKSLAYTYRVRLPRLLIPLGAWSLVSMARAFFTTLIVEGRADFGTLLSTLANIFVTPAAVHLWFLYALIPLYLISPAIKYLVDAAPRKLLWYLMALWAAGCAVASVRYLLPASAQYTVTFAFVEKLGFVGGWLGFFLLGYLLSTENICIKPLYLAAEAAVLTALIAAGTLIMTRTRGYYDESFKTYGTVWVIALASALFLLARYFDFAPRFPALLKYASDLSFCVYLCHNIIIACLATLGVYGESLTITAVCFAITVVVSTAISAAAGYIPHVSFILTGKSRIKLKKTE